MWSSIFRNKQKKEVKQLKTVLEESKKSSDFTCFSPSNMEDKIFISYFTSLVDSEKFQRVLLPYIKANIDKINSLEKVKSSLPFENMVITEDATVINDKLNRGYIFIQIKQQDNKGLLVNLRLAESGYRLSNDTENEFSVVGPKVGFIENLETNIFLLRQKFVASKLVFEEVTIGRKSKTRVMIVYIDGLTNPTYIETVRQRLSEIDFGVVFDSSLLDQIITDNSFTPFPLLLTTERVDRTTYALESGQVAIMCDGSPYVVTGPSTLLDFFISPEDYYLPWITGSFFRIIRIFGVIFSLFSTPAYVALLTFHYEVIPQDLLGPIISSRANVPFPPVIEVIFLELTIEFLREAGARLPTKIGQTLGIVGGIVIGQASVEAALTSNILLIVVSLSALASFTTPIFKMSNAIRLIRFPFILLASIWGGFGLLIGVVIMLTHLLKLKSFGNPYMVPLYPFRVKDFTDSFIRSSYEKTTKLPGFLRTLRKTRYQSKKKLDIKEGIDHE
ncbi:MAG: spore germination protein [Bacillota bacterium]